MTGMETDRRAVLSALPVAAVGATGSVVSTAGPGETATGAPPSDGATRSRFRQTAKLRPGDGSAFQNFGSSVALAGETALVGAPLEQDPNGRAAGAAYAFVRPGDGWTQQSKRVPADGDAGDSFGRSVALDGDTALVGAESDEELHGEHGGSAYVFERGGNTSGADPSTGSGTDTDSETRAAGPRVAPGYTDYTTPFLHPETQLQVQ
jgi:hypothetical protein